MDYQAMASRLVESLAALKRETHGKMPVFPGGELMLLRLIDRYANGVSPGELSDFCGVTAPRIAAALRGMEQKGWVVRATSPTDRRRTIVSITDEGHAAFAEFRSKHGATIESLLGELGEDDAREFMRIAERIVSILREMKSG
jgi:DNA-binding MarR family transcriptional regulator